MSKAPDTELPDGLVAPPETWFPSTVTTAVGAVLIHLTLGTIYCAGNVSPYIVSYIHIRDDKTGVTATDEGEILAIALAIQAFSMTLGGLAIATFGPRVSAMLGGATMSLGVALTYVSLAFLKSWWTALLTYSVISGLGVGVAYAAPLVALMSWMPHRKGLASGIVTAGFGGGAFIFNMVEVKFMNPANVKKTDDYFQDDEVLDNIPGLFLVLAVTYFCLQIVGCFLLRVKPRVDEDQAARRPPLSAPLSAPLGVPAQVQLSPGEMVRTRVFMMLLFTFFFNGLSVTVLLGITKNLGTDMYNINDDAFLTLVMSMCSVFNAFGRVFWGFMGDRIGVPLALSSMCATQCLLLIVLAVGDSLSSLSQGIFFVTFCLITMCLGGNFSLLPAATARYFGDKYFGKNYACVFLGLGVAAVSGGLATKAFYSSLGGKGIAIVLSVASAMGAVATFSLPSPEKFAERLTRGCDFRAQSSA